mmetsp:Transcript_25517/g.73707  ORF Transcript_25517/g.73707 Transcript_25517/m.73707 type:complete len:200 (-) Transcript_25517:540-1139(-)
MMRPHGLHPLAELLEDLPVEGSGSLAPFRSEDGRHLGHALLLAAQANELLAGLQHVQHALVAEHVVLRQLRARRELAVVGVHIRFDPLPSQVADLVRRGQRGDKLCRPQDAVAVFVPIVEPQLRVGEQIGDEAPDLAHQCLEGLVAEVVRGVAVDVLRFDRGAALVQRVEQLRSQPAAGDLQQRALVQHRLPPVVRLAR